MTERATMFPGLAGRVALVTDAVRAFVATSDEHFHVASPDAVGEVIAYLASDLAAPISGNVIQLR